MSEPTTTVVSWSAIARADKYAAYLRAHKGTLGDAPPHDPVEDAKTLYIHGAISLEAFEAKLDAIFSAALV